MKFVRGFFTCILIILASHGAYQLYKQHFKAPFQVSDDVRKELQSVGIHLDEMDDENGVTNLFSDSDDFGMYSENTRSSSMPPSFLSSGPETTPVVTVPPPHVSPTLTESQNPPLPVTSEPTIPYANGVAPMSQEFNLPAIEQPSTSETSIPAFQPLPEPGSSMSSPNPGQSNMPNMPMPETDQSDVLPASTPPTSPESLFPHLSEEPGVAVTVPRQTPPQTDTAEMTPKVSDAPVSNIAVMSGVKPNSGPEMSNIVPAPIMIDGIPEVAEQPGMEPSQVSEMADNPLLPDGFAMSGKQHSQTPSPRPEEILPVNSMSSGRPFDTVTPLPSVLDENDKNNIAGDIRQDIVQQCQSILPLFNSQDMEKIKDGYIQLSRLYFNKNLTPEEQRYIAVPLSQVAGGLFFSNQTHIIEPPYLVKEGETMESIATEMKVTPELLWKINGFAPQTNLQPGMQIKVIRGPLEAKIKPNTCELIITSKGHFVCRFKIGVGMNYAGQRGTFSVQDKAVNPAYDLGFGLDRIESGDPSNPLGCRWIKLSQMANNIGIHGTNRPDLIGVNDRSMVPPGVFFMKNEDVVEVCDMLVLGSPVVIER